MVSLLAIDWLALLEVAVVTIAATCAISALMSAANWFFTADEGLEQAVPSKRVIGWLLLGLMAVIVLFGLWLMIPYFHAK